MLKVFRLAHFKSYEHADLPLGPITLMIGANAAGKSNVIEALRLLSWLAQGHKLSSMQYAINSADGVLRGRVVDLPRRPQQRFSLGCQTDDPDWNSLEMTIELRDGELHIVEETVNDSNESLPLYRLDGPSVGVGTDAGVAYNNFSKGRNKPHVTVSDQMAVFGQLVGSARFDEKHERSQTEIPAVAKRYQSLLADILFLDPVPARMRKYSYQTDVRLRGDGTNLSSVLYKLWGGSDKPNGGGHEGHRDEILRFIKSLPEQDILDLEFTTTPRSEVLVGAIESFGGKRESFDASLLSDGTLRVLAIAAAMLSAPAGSLVVIEEIDNGVHPSRARALLDRIRTIAQDRKLRVLLSTHNPALVDALPDESLGDVVFCYRDPGTGASRLVRLADLPDAMDLFVQGPLGHLMTTGAIERFVKVRPDPDEKRRRALEWIERERAVGGAAP
ncbi:MAG: ATP-binding protein [Planctomycetia bacterium]|nr:ATP-binding protein [Planctomycetia bacterium]